MVFRFSWELPFHLGHGVSLSFFGAKMDVDVPSLKGVLDSMKLACIWPT